MGSRLVYVLLTAAPSRVLAAGWVEDMVITGGGWKRDSAPSVLDGRSWMTMRAKERGPWHSLRLPCAVQEDLLNVTRWLGLPQNGKARTCGRQVVSMHTQSLPALAGVGNRTTPSTSLGWKERVLVDSCPDLRNCRERRNQTNPR